MEGSLNGTAEAWRERIVAQQASGRSIRGWCRENGFAEPAFYWWRRRLGLSPARDAGANGRRRGRPVKAVGFAEVVADRTSSTASTVPELPEAVEAVEAICLRLGGGRELVLPGSMPVESIARLVRAIEGTGPEVTA